MGSRRLRQALAGAALMVLSALAGCGDSERAPFRIGVLADCTGILAETGDWSLAGAELPLLQHGGKLSGSRPAGGVHGASVAGRRVELVTGCTETGVYGRLIAETRQLVEIDHVDAVVGAFGASDGIVFREIARRYPTVPFLLAGTAAREATVHGPAPNLYRFMPDIEQDQAGLATYAYRTLGWRRAAVVAEDMPNGWGGAAAFAAEFCALGGSVKSLITPAYGADPKLLQKLPADVDGVLVLALYGFGTPVGFLRAYVASHPDAAHSLMLGLWVYPPLETADYASLWPALRGVVGTLAGVPDASSAADAAYRKAFARAFPGLPPGVASNLLVLPYYNAMQALLQAFEQTGGEPGLGRARLRSALASLRLATPAGTFRLDRNRQAVVPVNLVQLDGTAAGPPSFHRVFQIPAVDETLGGLLGPDVSPGPTATSCRTAALPPWAT